MRLPQRRSQLEKKKRHHDHSDPDQSKLATKPALGVFRTCNRYILDQERYHIATCGQHYPVPKHTKASLKVTKFPVMPLVCWAMARFPRNASKATEAPPFSRIAAWMAARP